MYQLLPSDWKIEPKVDTFDVSERYAVEMLTGKLNIPIVYANRMLGSARTEDR